MKGFLKNITKDVMNQIKEIANHILDEFLKLFPR